MTLFANLASNRVPRHYGIPTQMLHWLAETPPGPYSQWTLIALAVATVFYIFIIRPAMKKKKDPLARPASFGNLSQQRDVERQMQSLLVELSEMARQITAQLDTRAQKLQLLIQDADERIASLKRLDYQLAAVPSQRTKPELVPTMTQYIPIPEPVEEQHQPVYALADQGRSAGDIARELNRPRGEVDLILALRPAAQRV